MPGAAERVRVTRLNPSVPLPVYSSPGAAASAMLRSQIRAESTATLSAAFGLLVLDAVTGRTVATIPLGR